MGVGDLNIEWSCRKTGVEGGYKIPEAFRLRINVSVNLSQQNFSTICISCWLAIVSCTQKDYFMVVLRDVKGDDVFDQKMEEEYFLLCTRLLSTQEINLVEPVSAVESYLGSRFTVAVQNCRIK